LFDVSQNLPQYRLTKKAVHLLLVTPLARFAALACLASSVILLASQPWTGKDYMHWTTEDVQRILTASPWAQAASASFDTQATPDETPVAPVPGAAQAGMAGRNGASDGHWDGGVGRMPRGGVPSLQVIVRWDSALPIRQALVRSEPGERSTAQVQKDYIITVLGLVPAGSYRSAGRLETQSTSDTLDSTGRDAHDPEEMLEGLMSTSRLRAHGLAPIPPEDVKLDPATGAIHLFFPRSSSITQSNKEITFTTRFGSMKIEKTFRLKDMVYQGKLEL
jgi:hypothetical protein